MGQPWMSVVVPAYNEETAIAATVGLIQQRLGERGLPYVVIVVDNASEDGTVDALAPLVDGERVRLLRNDVNRGKGFSVRRGMLDATGELRLLCDADCGPSLVSLPAMLEAIEEADVVAGPGGPAAAAAAPPRRLAVHRDDAAAAERADARRLLRLQALARGGG
jgi:dolichyl-phosphate beta-glucosyltransferase